MKGIRTYGQKEDFKDIIVEILKEEIEISDVPNGYNQWILGVSIREERSKTRVLEKPYYTIRVVIITSDSFYVIAWTFFWVQDGKIQMAQKFTINFNAQL